MAENKHRHRTIKRSEAWGFTVPVRGKQNQKAWGGVSWQETCRCGAERGVNANQGHIERGPWEMPPALTQDD